MGGKGGSFRTRLDAGRDNPHRSDRLVPRDGASYLTMTWPLSATRTWPVIVRALSEHRNTIASAMS